MENYQHRIHIIFFSLFFLGFFFSLCLSCFILLIRSPKLLVFFLVFFCLTMFIFVQMCVCVWFYLTNSRVFFFIFNIIYMALTHMWLVHKVTRFHWTYVIDSFVSQKPTQIAFERWNSLFWVYSMTLKHGCVWYREYTFLIWLILQHNSISYSMLATVFEILFSNKFYLKTFFELLQPLVHSVHCTRRKLFEAYHYQWQWILCNRFAMWMIILRSNARNQIRWN